MRPFYLVSLLSAFPADGGTLILSSGKQIEKNQQSLIVVMNRREPFHSVIRKA